MQCTMTVPTREATTAQPTYSTMCDGILGEHENGITVFRQVNVWRRLGCIVHQCWFTSLRTTGRPARHSSVCSLSTVAMLGLREFAVGSIEAQVVPISELALIFKAVIDLVRDRLVPSPHVVLVPTGLRRAGELMYLHEREVCVGTCSLAVCTSGA